VSEPFRATCPECGRLQAEGVIDYCADCDGRLIFGIPKRGTARRLRPQYRDYRRFDYVEGCRFVVRESEGYTINEASLSGRMYGYAKPNLSCVVLDTAWNHKRVAEYRTEEEGSKLGLRRAKIIRAKARNHAGRLNAELAA
jgi:hypothetical protein